LQAFWPDAANAVYRVQLNDGGTRRDVVLDAGSGRRLEPRQTHLLLRVIRRVHTSLFAGRIGSRLVLYASVVTLLSLMLGLVLWWPGLRKIVNGFRVRFRRGAYILNFDLHQSLGVLAWPLLFIMTLTGVLLGFPRVVQRIDRTFGAGPPTWSPPPSTPPAQALPGPARPALRLLAERAAAVTADARVARLSYPSQPTGVIRATVVAGRDSFVVALDRYSGEVLGREPRAGLRFDGALNDRLHFGRLGGPVVRALYMLACVMGGVMLPTGITMWWLTRTRKAESAERRASRVAPTS
jgi:uncharacterized iron-regulated membrane protein